MSDFRKLEEGMFASPQITPADIKTAQDMGVKLVVNNRPDGEAPDQIAGSEIEAAARNAGMEYLAIPVTQAGFSQSQVAQMAEGLENAGGPVLAYCRSGTRSTLLWALARASRGGSPEELARAAAAAGYDVGPVRPAMDMLASGKD